MFKFDFVSYLLLFELLQGKKYYRCITCSVWCPASGYWRVGITDWAFGWADCAIAV